LGVQEVSIGNGYASGRPAVCHFGLGDHPIVDVEIVLPSGQRKRLMGVKADRQLVIRE
jgi:hypothetical protein